MTKRQCSFEGCGRDHYSRGLCKGHRMQQYRGKDLAPLRRRNATDVRNELGQKRCSRCTAWLPEAVFHKNPKTNDRLATSCSSCARDVLMLHKYGLSSGRYEELLTDQSGTCAICRQVPKGYLHVDHDHSCCPGEKTCGQCVRGLLCTNCNKGLGCFQDSPLNLTNAANYLTNHERKT